MRSWTCRTVLWTGMVLASPTFAADWDHDANIETAVITLLAAYRTDGMPGVERLVSGCYEAGDRIAEPDDRLQRLEQCAGMDFAAYRVDRSRTGGAEAVPAAYFTAERIMGRLERLSAFLQAPGVQNQVLRAWSRAATDALERAGAF